MKQLLIATNNKGKIKELKDLLQATGIELITPAQINLDLDVIEDGQTYAENAAKKAVAFARVSASVPVEAASLTRPRRYASSSSERLPEAHGNTTTIRIGPVPGRSPNQVVMR